MVNIWNIRSIGGAKIKGCLRKLNLEEFKAWKNKKITLLGMSGVGKTHLASMLRDYNGSTLGRLPIGTRYLDEPIMDLIKQQAMLVPFRAT